MYDEIEITKKNIKLLKKENCPIIVIQSDPHSDFKKLNHKLVDYYELLPDVAGSKELYEQEQKEQLDVEWKDVKIMKTPARALTRNWRKAFSASKQFDVDWWVIRCRS